MSNIAQKYSRATQTSDLKDDAHHHQTEVLAAVALSSELGSLLFRVKFGNDATSHKALLEKWLVIVGKKSVFRSWPSHVAQDKVAQASLEYWLCDLCGHCEGKGYHVLAGAPVLSDDPCKVCKGTGKKPLACEKRIRDYVEDMVQTLEVMTIHASGEAMRKLSQQMDF